MINHKVIGFKSDKSHFEVIASGEVAMAWLTLGNAEGINRICSKPPSNTVAVLKQRAKSLIELIAPSGDTITRESGRVDAKRVMAELKVMGIKCLNVKKGGGMVEM